MCDRRVLERVGHDSLVDLAQRQCDLIQELDGVVAGLRAELDEERAIPQCIVTGLPVTEETDLAEDRARMFAGWPSTIRYADGMDPTMWESLKRWEVGRAGIPPGADAEQDDAPDDDQKAPTEPVGHDKPDNPTPGEGAARSDAPQSVESLRSDDGWPPVLLDKGGERWVLQPYRRNGEPVYVYAPVVGALGADGLTVAKLHELWGPLTAVEE